MNYRFRRYQKKSGSSLIFVLEHFEIQKLVEFRLLSPLISAPFFSSINSWKITSHWIPIKTDIFEEQHLTRTTLLEWRTSIDTCCDIPFFSETRMTQIGSFQNQNWVISNDPIFKVLTQFSFQIFPIFKHIKHVFNAYKHINSFKVSLNSFY